MNFNTLEFTNTDHNNVNYRSLIEQPQQSQSNLNTPVSITSNNIEKNIDTSFFSTNNFLKKLASGTLFTGRSSIFSSPMQHQQEQQQQQQQHIQQQQNSISDTLNETLLSASSSIMNHRNSNIYNSSSNVLPITSTIGSNNIVLPQEYLTNSVILNASTFSEEAWQRQIEYDKFMNEIWIGIVLTLIIISMVFCICSCFLYHQFRLWKINYRQSVQQNHDIESVKFNLDDDDPVPQYTLVSGLPTYEAAIDMLSKSPNCSLQQQEKFNNINNRCIEIKTYPSVFSIFTKTEKPLDSTLNNLNTTTIQSSLTLNESIHKSSSNIEKLPSAVELKSLVNNTITTTINTSNSNNITTIQNSNSDENYGNFHLLSYNVMHRNSNDQTTTSTSSVMLAAAAEEENNDEVIEAESSGDEEIQNQEVIPLQQHSKNN